MGGSSLLPSSATPLPFLSCPLTYFNSRHKTLQFGENFMKIGPKLKKLISMFKGQFYTYVLYFWGIYCGVGLYLVSCLDTKHITWHMVPSFLYDHTKSALPRIPLPSKILAGVLYTVFALNIQTDIPEQTVLTQIKLLLKWSGSTLFQSCDSIIVTLSCRYSNWIVQIFSVTGDLFRDFVSSHNLF